MFRAKYPGICYVCQDNIGVGDLIYWVEGEPVIHNECVPT